MLLLFIDNGLVIEYNTLWECFNDDLVCFQIEDTPYLDTLQCC